MKKTSVKYPKDLLKKAARIKALLVDVDGVLTDGRIIYDDNGRELKNFNVRDGAIVSYLQKAGVVCGIVSGRDSPAVTRRASELRMDFCHQGIVDKADAMNRLLKHYKLKEKEFAYVGDDIGDLSVLEKAGLSACPADTLDYIKTRVDFVTNSRGGEGVMREVADLILRAQRKSPF